jgi:hypothetical protein
MSQHAHIRKHKEAFKIVTNVYFFFNLAFEMKTNHSVCQEQAINLFEYSLSSNCLGFAVLQCQIWVEQNGKLRAYQMIQSSRV